MGLRSWIQIRILLFSSDANKKLVFSPKLFAFKVPKDYLHQSSKTECDYGVTKLKQTRFFEIFCLGKKGSVPILNYGYGRPQKVRSGSGKLVQTHRFSKKNIWIAETGRD
jgi:hypothetical protein